MNQNHRIFHISRHRVLIINEIRREVSTIKLHSFDHLKFIFQSLAFFNGNYTFLTNLFHRFGNDAADGIIRIRGHGTHLRDFFMIRTRLGEALKRINGRDDRLVDTTL